MEIKNIDQTGAELWNGFLEDFPAASFYHLFQWRSVMEDLGHQAYYLASIQNGDISGILPLVFVKSHIFGRILCSMPFLNYGGACTKDDDSRMALVEKARSLMEELGADYVEIRGTEPAVQTLPTSNRKVSMTLDLHGDPDVIWNAFSTKHRTQIRRSYKNQLRVESGGQEMLDTFYRVLSVSFRNLGTPLLGRSFFSGMMDALGGRIKIFIVYQGETPVAGALNGYYGDTVEGMWAGTLAPFIRLGPVYILYWEMIKDACLNGYRVYHFGRSSRDSGGEFYKKKWNAQMKPLYFQYHLNKNSHLPEFNVDNPKYRFAISAWKKLPVSLTRIIGPPLARSIP